MPHNTPVGNDSLLVGFDATCQLHDLYWLHVRQEILAAGPQRALVLALTKAGLHSIDSDLFIADIDSSPDVCDELGLPLDPHLNRHNWARMESAPTHVRT